MNRTIRTLSILFIVHMFAINAAYANPFKLFSKTKETDDDMKTIKAAEQMYDMFANDKPVSHQVPVSLDETLSDPFESRLPVDETAPTPEPSDKVSEYIPEITKYNNTETPPPNFKISGLVWNSDEPQAILNDQVVGIGDQIKGWTITKISEQGIVVKTLADEKYLIKADKELP